MNPFADTLSFLMRNEWPIYVFWLLLLGSIGVAAVNLIRDPDQRTGAHVWMWVARLFIGGLWWQQTLWKLPPTYTDNPGVMDSGLYHWVGEMAKYAAFGWQQALVKNVVLP